MSAKRDAELVEAMLKHTRSIREADEFYRWKDKILRTLEYISTNAGSNDHGVEIAEMATGLLADLGVE